MDVSLLDREESRTGFSVACGLNPAVAYGCLRAWLQDWLPGDTSNTKL